MPYYTQSEFAKLIGKSNAFVSTYIRRGKIIKSGKVIDSSVRENSDMMKKFGVGDNVPASKKKSKEIVIEKPKRNKTITSAPIISPPVENNGGQYQLDLDKKEAELEFKLVSTRIKLIEESKLRGELIPVDLVSELIATMSRSIVTSYKDSMDLFLIEINHRAKISDKFAAELKGEMTSLINKAHDNAIDKAISGVKEISPKLNDDGKV
ncbi:MAG: hypothetical protein JKY43_10155 [Phycisphaerales bacterium]|nr:hypothetical protein [Phycisphaerales bacterium]